MIYRRNEASALEVLEPRLLLSASSELSQLAESATGLQLATPSEIQLTSSIDLPKQSEMYQFVAEATTGLTVDMFAVGEDLDPYLRLYQLRNGRLRTVRRNNNAARGTRDSRIVYEVQAGQTYYIRPMGRSRTTGEYELHVSAELIDEAGNTFDGAMPVSVRRSGRARFKARMDYDGDVDVFEFTATKTGMMTVTQSPRRRTDTFECSMFVYHADEELLASSEGPGPAAVSFQVAAGEVYYLEVVKPDGQTGEYRLTFKTRGGPVNRPPKLERIGDKLILGDSALAFAVSATDRDGDVLTYSASNLPEGAAFDPDTGEFSWTPTAGQAGLYDSVHFEVSDGTLSDAEDVDITVAVPDVNEPPVLNLIGDRTVRAGSTLAFTVSGTDSDGDPLSYSAANLPAGATFDGGTGGFQWTPTLAQEGDYEGVRFVVSDGELFDSEDITIAVTPALANEAPVLEVIGDRSVELGSTLTFTISATDAHGDPLTYSAWSLPVGATFDPETRIFSWTPLPARAQTYQVTVYFVVSDGGLADYEGVVITVYEAPSNGAPVLDPISDRTVEAGSALAFTLGATDPDGDALSYSASNLPAGASLDPDTGDFSWTPTTGQVGVYGGIGFAVSDGELSDSQNITITVTAPPQVNEPPVLHEIQNRFAALGSALTFTVSATDPDGDALTFSASHLPSGAAFNPATRTFYWMPTAAQLGVHSGVHFEVTDGEFTDSEDIAITVAQDPTNFVPIGPGLTNAYYIDADADGYGVASPLGPDADDSDPDVNTPESMLQRYGSLQVFLAARGYPTDVVEFTPATFSQAAFSAARQPNRTIVFREGVYRDGNYPVGASGFTGPFVIMAYPGERAVIDAAGGCINFTNSENIVVDGMVVDNRQGWDEGAGITIGSSRFITIRNVEGLHHKWEIKGTASHHYPEPIHDILIEGCALHDSGQEHGIYIGARDYLVNYNITVADCLIYRRGRHAFQHNGPVANLTMTGNIMHSNHLGGISLINGCSGGVFRGNLMFNNNSSGIILYTYDSEVSIGILPLDITDNVFEDNIIWMGRTSWNDRGRPNENPAICLNEAIHEPEYDRSIAGNLFARNIIVTHDGEAISCHEWENALTNEYRDNIFYNRNGRVFGTGEGRLPGQTDGSHTEGPLTDYERYYWNIGDFETFPLTSGNTFEDPGFADVSWDYYNQPERFDFRR